MEQPPSNVGGWDPTQTRETLVPMRTPKSLLSPNAPTFVPKRQQPSQIPEQQPGGAYQHPGQHYQPPMDMHQSSQPSMVQHRFAAAQGNVEPGGGGGGGGGGYDYQQQMGHHLGGNNGAVPNGNNDPGKVSAVQNRLSNMRIGSGGGGGGGGGMSRGDNNGKEFNHHQHHQQPMQQQQHHLQHRVQQPYHGQYQGGHHGHNHHQPHGQQQLHQPQYPYGAGYSNAINNHLNHPILGAANHHMGGGGDNRKHNGGGGGGGGGQQHHRSRQQQHQHQHHHHQHHQGSHHHGGGGAGGGGGGGGGGHGMMGGGHIAPMGGGGGNVNAAGGDYNDDEQNSELQSFALDYLTEVIAELFDNPGMFENVQQKLWKMFMDFRDDNYVLSNAVEMIFEQSIKESNFRYMGARLCQLLDSLDDKPESLMRNLLRLKMDDQQSELPNYMKQEQVKVRGTTLFLAELYMQLRSPQHKLGQDIARHIFHAIDNLLAKEGPENLKCICQCLKLCGFELEQDCYEDVHRILGKLQQSQSSSQSSVSNLIKSVLDLQSKSWGRSEEIVPVAPLQAMPNLMGGAVLAMGGGGGGSGAGGLEFNDSPVFYGPDGEILTEEENSFLETNMINKQNAAYNGYDDDEEVFDDMNPEVNLAFKDFLQSVPNEQQQQQQQQQQH